MAGLLRQFSSLPGCISQGKTEEEAKENIKGAIEFHLKSLAEEGIPFYPANGMSDTFVAVNV
ncbi:type II toxin-antitoxin system HicB family antitoxin [Methanoplanus limicola]|uniref:Uncharacterized protein family UPF0150 n=1 Tax=Methanoplanus limicola DSM 2279 TaxID=937775 RepID=H1Z0R5_9EURY|nr:type II toxin-antitoxin system HicB family antitoxin [Methanoplanus limicola]EHQ36208.1 Uncharacterized protein family UPF0150 [Methanoplanus limicola DSM 2279]